MESKKKTATQARLKDEKCLSFFDVDARAELRSVPLATIWIPPRIGEYVELRADIEHGGGVYLIVGIRHILEDDGPTPKPSATVTRVIVDLKPQHAATTEADAAAVDLLLENEIVSIPVTPLPMTIELPSSPEPEE